MKRKSKFIALGIIASFAVFLAACTTDEPDVVVQPDTTNGAQDTTTDTTDDNGDDPVVAPTGDERLERHGLDENLRFIEPVTISVGLWDRGHERVPDFDQSYWAQWVQAQILEDHNIIVEWVTIPRWDEGDVQSMLLAGGQAPDIGYTFSNPMVTSFADMGGIMDLMPLLEEYGDWLPHMYELITPDNIYWNLNPQTNELWTITGRLIQDGRTLTFIREDWLNTLGLPIPTTLAEFESTLEAFRDNQDTIMPDRTRSLIPFMLGHDVGWGGSLIFDSFIPNDISERDFFVHGFDDRRFHFEDAVREGTRVLNRWFNNDLLWNDFILHPPGDPMGDDLTRLGYVGSAIWNWDNPFRAADEIITTMQENIGPEANFIAITPFLNDAGIVRNLMPNPTDRFIFFPHTNANPVASMLYLDWISRPDVVRFLQFGIEGVHHEVLPNGAILTLGETDDHIWPDNQFIPSLRNFDITMTVNGIFLPSDELTAATLALGYPGIAPEAIMAARAAGLDHAYRFRQVQHRTIEAQEGMSGPLADQRDVMWHQVIAATSIEDFDTVWNNLYSNYMALGAAAIIAEREQAWVEEFGDVADRPGR